MEVTPMCFIFSLFPATIFAIIGYFVLFASSRADGGVRTFGKVLATWIFIIALFFPICGAYVTITGKCRMEKMMHGMDIPVEKMIEEMLEKIER
jgi:hypothetical protein